MLKKKELNEKERKKLKAIKILDKIMKMHRTTFLPLFE